MQRIEDSGILHFQFLLIPTSANDVYLTWSNFALALHKRTMSTDMSVVSPFVSLIYTPPTPVRLLHGSRYPRMIAHRTYVSPPYEIVGVGMRTCQRPMAAQTRAEVDPRRRSHAQVSPDLPVWWAGGRPEHPQRRAPPRRVRLRGPYLHSLLSRGGVRTARV